MTDKLLRVQAECTSEQCIGDYEVQMKLHMKLFNQPPHRSKEISNSTQMELLCGSKITGDSKVMACAVIDFICKELGVKHLDFIKDFMDGYLYRPEFYKLRDHVNSNIAKIELSQFKEL